MSQFDRTRPLGAQLCDVLGVDAQRCAGLTIELVACNRIEVRARYLMQGAQAEAVVKLLRAAHLVDDEGGGDAAHG